MDNVHLRDLKPLHDGVPIYEPLVRKLNLTEEPEPDSAFTCISPFLIGYIIGGAFGTIVGWIIWGVIL